MHRIIGVTELQRNFRAVFDEVARDDIAYVLTRGSRPEAAIIPYDAFTRFVAWQEQEIVAEFDRAILRLAERNAGYGDDEIAADVKAAVDEARATQAPRP
jgi:prevent-host-death family protein